MVEIADGPVIAATYSARTTELVYRHLLSQLPFDEDIDEFIGKIMKCIPPQIGPGSPAPNPNPTPQGTPNLNQGLPAILLSPAVPMAAGSSTSQNSAPSSTAPITAGANTAPGSTSTGNGNTSTGANTPTEAASDPIIPLHNIPSAPANDPPAEDIPGSLAYEIRKEYTDLKNLEFTRYLEHIATRFEKRNDPDQKNIIYKDPDVVKHEYRLDHYVGIAEQELKSKLADQT